MKPKYKIIADDNDITELIHSRLISLSISDEIGIVSDTMTMELDDRDSAFALPSSGAIWHGITPNFLLWGMMNCTRWDSLLQMK